MQLWVRSATLAVIAAVQSQATIDTPIEIWLKVAGIDVSFLPFLFVFSNSVYSRYLTKCESEIIREHYEA